MGDAGVFPLISVLKDLPPGLENAIMPVILVKRVLWMVMSAWTEYGNNLTGGGENEAETDFNFSGKFTGSSL